MQREPRRIALLSAAADAASCLVCPLVDRVFSGPDARIPVPAFGSAAIVASAVLIGAVLGRAGGASGVRAAATTTLLFTFSKRSKVSTATEPSTRWARLPQRSPWL
jgi:hypothetical protein